ncbi:divergent PAP2 family protein, partial [bacterium]|nr:divergent PAP2 family protein [bacterium]
MDLDILNTGYEVLSCGIMAAFLAQVIKFFLFTLKNKKVNFKIFTTTGGMPSSHSAGVMGL